MKLTKKKRHRKPKLKVKGYASAFNAEMLYTEIDPSLKLVFPIKTLRRVALPSFASL